MLQLYLSETAHIKDPKFIKLSNKSFDYEAACVIAERVSSMTNIVVADLSDMIAGRPEVEALKVLKVICDRYILTIKPPFHRKEDISIPIRCSSFLVLPIEL